MDKVKIIPILLCLVFITGIVAYADHYGQININTATKDQLMMLPQIKEDVAQNIINYREAKGPFKSLNELLKVKGMNSKIFTDVSRFLKLEGLTTFKPSDLKMLQEEPGGKYY
jgi:competence protein ComEA